MHFNNTYYFFQTVPQMSEGASMNLNLFLLPESSVAGYPSLAQRRSEVIQSYEQESARSVPAPVHPDGGRTPTAKQ